MLVFLFFFSSRRRHTRYIGDWSSDVCSSDLSRFCAPPLGRFLEDLIQRERFDSAVVDHLAPTTYFPRLEEAVFFQHNVETTIWRRHVEQASGLRKLDRKSVV